MAVQIVMDHTGDTRHHFNPADAKAVAEAEARFKELTGTGFIAAKRLGRRKKPGLEEFRPNSRGDTVRPAAPGRLMQCRQCWLGSEDRALGLRTLRRRFSEWLRSRSARSTF
jgi:hypothetical protein